MPFEVAPFYLNKAKAGCFDEQAGLTQNRVEMD